VPASRHTTEGIAMTGRILHERLDGGIVRVVIDNRQRRNAMNNAMWDALGTLMRELDADESLRCIVVTGAGEEAFGAGADISEFEENRSTAQKAMRFAERTHATLRAVKGCRHPVVASIRGLCVGGGLELALCADLRIAAEGARFGIPVKRLGLVVAYEEMQGLVETVGKANTLRILLEGDIFGAEEALRMGLVNHLLPADGFEDSVMERVRLIAEGAPLVARWHKTFANRLMDGAPLTDEERAQSYACFDTEDFRIGYRAFLEKRKPDFTGT